MISFENALNIVLNSSFIIGTENISILNCLNRVIAEDIKSDINMPPFNKAAMDGYACKHDDLEHPLEVVDNIPAGKLPEQVISDKQCAKIMTDAMVPEGADCVIMIEHAEQLSDGRIKFTKEITNKNIC